MKKFERFWYVPNDWNNRVFNDKTEDIIDLALSLVENDVAEELRDCVDEVIDNYEEYDLCEDDMFDLLREWFTFDDILWHGKVDIEQLKEWIADEFFYRLNRNEIKLRDEKEENEKWEEEDEK